MKLSTLEISRREQQMKKPPQQYKQKHTRGINGQQLKVSLATKKITPATQDMSPEEPAK